MAKKPVRQNKKPPTSAASERSWKKVLTFRVAPQTEERALELLERLPEHYQALVGQHKSTLYRLLLEKGMEHLEAEIAEAS